MSSKSQRRLDQLISWGTFIIVLGLYIVSNFSEGAVFRGILKYGSVKAMVEAEYIFEGEEITRVTNLEIDKRENIKDITSMIYSIEFESESGKFRRKKFVSREEYTKLEIGMLYDHYYIFKNIRGGYSGLNTTETEGTPIMALVSVKYKEFWKAQILLILLVLIGGYIYTNLIFDHYFGREKEVGRV